MKYTIKLFGIIAFISIIGFSMLACDMDGDSGNEPAGTPGVLTIINNTGDFLNDLYIREPGTATWDFHSEVGISSGNSETVNIPYNRRDILLETLDYDIFYTKLSQTINGTVIFTSSDLDNDSARRIYIVNSTGENFKFLNIIEHDTATWRPMGISPLSSKPEVTIPRDMMDDQYRTDIQLEISNGNTYTKLAQEIIHNGTVTFTIDDLDPDE